ncbi:hypothetical protein BU16DRAFT_564117 [Lophium mytilinum]|uniref:Uncharacterized protein n=1 Tax=Lophium mytilinum TaxID=390894 RepID=A0A6A6QPH0_9PEZI|nr:hypothetical protein BU16DRAFT_564117 [Lophium mytilinum]
MLRKSDWPALSQWADYIIFSSPVENDETNGIVLQALANAGKELGHWPERVEFAATMREGQTLLASANGRGVAWMLIDHKADLVLKKVEYVTVFRDDGNGERVSTLIFKITGV